MKDEEGLTHSLMMPICALLVGMHAQADEERPSSCVG